MPTPQGRYALAILLLIAFAGLALAQTAAQPSFEVASVKPSASGVRRDTGGGPGTSDPGQYHFYGAELHDLVFIAYHLRYTQQLVSKAPLDRDSYDLVAKVPAGATRDEFRLMLQHLLAERFHLKAHMESRELPALELTIGKSGSKLQESTTAGAGDSTPQQPKIADDGFPVLPAGRPGLAMRYTTADGFMIGRMAARQQPVEVLTRNYGRTDDLPIVDKTGLTGTYDFRLEFSREPPGMPGGEAKVAPVPDLFTAIQQQLGLQFIPKKLPFDILVVDSFDRVPTEN